MKPKYLINQQVRVNEWHPWFGDCTFDCTIIGYVKEYVNNGRTVYILEKDHNKERMYGVDERDIIAK